MRTIALLATLALAAPQRATASDITATSRVASAIVYQGQALVTREAHLTLPPGIHRVTVDTLPSVADPDSVRATGTGTAGIVIDGLEVRQEFGQPDLTPDYRRLHQEIGDLGRRQALLEGRAASIASLREFLTSLKATAAQEGSRDLAGRGFAVDSWRKAFDFLSTGFDRLSEEERGIETRRKDVAESLGIARGRLAQIASQSGTQRWVAVVFVSAPRGGEVTLRLTYLAGNAAWVPFYDARLDPDGETVTLSWQAQVSQNTGEDWTDVAVTLSTTRPAAGIDLPVLACLRLRPETSKAGTVDGVSFTPEFIDSLPVIGWNYQDVLALAPGVSDDAGGSNTNIHGARDTQVVDLIQSQARAERREVAVSFDLPGPIDVPSDGQSHKHLIATRSLHAAIERQVIPGLAPAVYLVAKATLPGEIPILPGRAQHFVGSDLVGRTSLSYHAGGEALTLSFGPDDRVRSERKQVERTVGHRGRDDEIEYLYVTTLENHLGRDVVVHVRDRIPVSGDDRIEISLDDRRSTPQFTTDAKEPGILTWRVLVPKDGSQEVALRYEVRLPRGLAVEGLE
ncbi:MAG TPA: DUF4139 domain-containing protein [Candidatus Polarisedimenticolia bacterium]|nr:DUF4139 domain-containing protein [Candidatus Polarisedimenticolia bacterium]